MLYRNKQLLRHARKGHVPRIQREMANGADINCRGKYGYTALMEAASNGHLEAVHFLLKAGAAPRICADDGAPPTFFACVRAHTEVVNVLLEAGADPNALRDDHCARRPGDSPGVSLLHIAIREGLAETASALVASGARVDHVAYGETALQAAEAAGMPSVVAAIKRVRRA